MSKKTKRWSKSIGERGNRVRIYESRPGSTLMRSIWINGKEDRKSLGHCDKQLAVKQAYELLAMLVADEKAIQEELSTLGLLRRLYTKSEAFLDKKEQTRKEESRCLERMVDHLGPDRLAETLTDSDLRKYANARKKGDRSLIGVKEDAKVGTRTVERDLVVLRTMLNWAEMERDRHGRRLLKDNPLRGMSFVREKNPKRPVVNHQEFESLLEVAGSVHPLLRLALIVAEGTGRRLSAWRQLKWSDVDLKEGTIRWRAETDKKGYESVVPISASVRAALLAAQKESKAIGDTWIFSNPRKPSQPCSRCLLHRWLDRAYVKAEITREAREGWHSLRRKWATERKHLPLADVARAGGWKNSITLQLVYQQPDPDTMKAVVENPVRLAGNG